MREEVGRMPAGAGMLGLVAMFAGTAAEPSPCLACHPPEEPAIAALLASPHGGLREAGCVDCHGASVAHRRRPGEPPERIFAGQEPAAARNTPCLGCHRAEALHWETGGHGRAELACVDCHRVHRDPFPPPEAWRRVEDCLGCHPALRAATLKPFNHPLGEGEFDCGACHDPHGSLAARAGLREASENETCYRCHADLRGPFLWEHRPVRERCGDCHAPHGSVHPGMLEARAPFLCQLCHLAQFHPSALHAGAGLPGATRPSGSAFLLGPNCMSCHPAVHGSNHPSGARLTR
ncbi:MAG: DmsE family decaheme c-type cytochrome [Xanthomonadales bacterium]|nr:DmsE family decaheme c-type cytochrome [Xanthomonadales bacterium]